MADREVKMEELSEIWDEQRRAGICYSGCTHDALRQRYGDKLYHKTGVGWFVRETSPET